VSTSFCAIRICAGDYYYTIAAYPYPPYPGGGGGGTPLDPAIIVLKFAAAC
jgi:hypothetical protein